MLQRFYFGLLAVYLTGCAGGMEIERTLVTPESFRSYSASKVKELHTTSPFLKAHLKNGNLCIFQAWDTAGNGTEIMGRGVLLSTTRDTLSTGTLYLALDSVSILETNVLQESDALSALSIMTGVTLSVAVICLTNPKACFGSCPTFYVSDGDSSRLQAEGFSSSISPSLEAVDIDALYHAKTTDDEVIVEMKNEALETHIVRHADILAVPRLTTGRVFKGTDHQFWQAKSLVPPVKVSAPEGDCLPLLLHADWNERISLADTSNLGKKELIDVNFHVKPGSSYGLVVGSRQALLPTYLLYQTFAYMGENAGHWLAEIERKHITSKQAGIERLIGGIEILTQIPDGTLHSIGAVAEHGPLAVDMHLIPLGILSGSIFNIQLRLTKGAWRLDYIALAELSGTLEPIRIHPEKVMFEGIEDPQALASLLDSSKTLVTFPGDSYSLHYPLPTSDTDYELFLESRGYYLEWIRQEWIAEQNAFYLAQMFFDPANALKRMAPEFKAVEPSMEDCFWRSRYAKP